jgi:cell division protein FtsN
MIILALSVAGLALFLGGVLTGVLLSDPGGPLVDLRTTDAAETQSPPPPLPAQPAPADAAPPPPPPVVIAQPPEPPAQPPQQADTPPPEALITTPSALPEAPLPPEAAPPEAENPSVKIEEKSSIAEKDISPDIIPARPQATTIRPQPKPAHSKGDSAAVAPVIAAPAPLPTIAEAADESIATTLDPAISLTPPPTAKADTNPASDGKSRFVIQAGAFSKQDNAEKRAEVLRTMGYTVHIDPVAMSSGRTLFVVLVGAYDSPRQAASDRQKLRAAGIETALSQSP